MVTLRWGMSGEAVKLLQNRLKELGYFAGAVDGRFGPLTHSAVVAFQRDKGLTVDGIVGPATYAALGLAEEGSTSPQGPGPGSAGGQALSLHIGVNSVDPAKYGGWSGVLSGCENDARTMTAIAAAEGFTTTQLFTRQATTTNVLNGIRHAAGQLTAGGTFLLTYAGHGGQVPNEGADDEDDQQDETWVLYDRQLLDDEIEQAFAAFKPGVNIVMLSDSCHSGTVHRRMDDPLQLPYAELKRSFYTTLGVSRAGPGEDDAILSFPRPATPSGDPLPSEQQEQRSLMAQVYRLPGDVTQIHAGEGNGVRGLRYPGQGTAQGVGLLERATRTGAVAGEASSEASGGVLTRELPLGNNVVANQVQADVLEAVKIASQSRGSIQANGLLISGCQDAQLSQEVGGNGVFTTTLKRVWANNGFVGSYNAFHRAIVSQMGPTQTPMLSLFGSDPNSLVARTPFNP